MGNIVIENIPHSFAHPMVLHSEKDMTLPSKTTRHPIAILTTTLAIPSGYSYTSTFARTFLAGSLYFTPDEVETFYETT